VDLIDRIAGFLRDLFGEESPHSDGGAARPRAGRSVDPDLDRAWQELNDYLHEGRDDSTGAGSRGRSDQRGYRSGSRGPAPPRPMEALRQDYANLEVPFGADMETVRRSYKTLMLRYHPDKHAGNPEELRVATEISKRINESFERIRSFNDSGRG
jgi:DnaJ-domain-containing protein 1